MDKKKINDFLMELGEEWLIWKHNPLNASNMGGVWEQQIRSARSILAALTKQHGESLNDENVENIDDEFNTYLMSFGLNRKRKFLLLCSPARHGIAQNKNFKLEM